MHSPPAFGCTGSRLWQQRRSLFRMYKPKKLRREGSLLGSTPNSHRNGAESLVTAVVNLDSHFKLLEHSGEDF